ncbi:hypothetical protein MA16_Dca001852 [Dendrobium catenatum]|uniref:Uncharacterized protein n=1 Tax=Dendrobium catenatum TaxID=906689 RepID=A0A2I0XDM4_9ASPA|nr:hypothetical protein MA16_Dca001852 [Dendrobium catenatum]
MKSETLLFTFRLASLVPLRLGCSFTTLQLPANSSSFLFREANVELKLPSLAQGLVSDRLQVLHELLAFGNADVCELTGDRLEGRIALVSFESNFVWKYAEEKLTGASGPLTNWEKGRGIANCESGAIVRAESMRGFVPAESVRGDLFCELPGDVRPGLTNLRDEERTRVMEEDVSDCSPSVEVFVDAMSPRDLQDPSDTMKNLIIQ